MKNLPPPMGAGQRPSETGVELPQAPSTFPISVFDGARSVSPDAVYPTIQEIIEELTHHEVYPDLDKLDLPAFSPTAFNPPRRRAAHATKVSMAVLDYDDGTTVDEAMLDWSGWFSIIYSTWSHSVDHPKYRVVLPLRQPVPAAHWGAAWAWLFKRARGRIDAACKDASRLFFLPAVRSEDWPRFAKVVHGEFLDIPWWERLSDVGPGSHLDVAIDDRQGDEPCLELPAALARRIQNSRLRTDPAVRFAVAELLGAHVAGSAESLRAEEMVCPACRCQSVWFWINPLKKTRASCHHRKSCGWDGPLRELLEVPHE